MPLPIRITIGLLVFLSAGAVGGGAGILSDPSGGFLKMSARDLAGSPFSSFLIPGLFLLIVLGFGSGVAAFLLWRRPGRASWFAAAGISVALLIWLAVQVAVVGYRHWLQPFYAVLGVVMLALLMAGRGQDRTAFFRT